MAYITYYLTFSIHEKSRRSLVGSYAFRCLPGCQNFWKGLQSFLELTEASSTSKLSHASHFDCFPWFCELSPSCLHLLANRLPRMFPLVASLGPLTVPSMALDPYPERARACPTPYMLSVIPPYTCTTSS